MLLLAGLDNVHLGKTFARYEERGGRVVAHFADGTTEFAKCMTFGPLPHIGAKSRRNNSATLGLALTLRMLTLAGSARRRTYTHLS